MMVVGCYLLGWSPLIVWAAITPILRITSARGAYQTEPYLR